MMLLSVAGAAVLVIAAPAILIGGLAKRLFLKSTEPKPRVNLKHHNGDDR